MNDLYATSKYSTVTFDVFDTLVIRNAVKPVDVFEMVGGRLFRYARIAAEMAARKLSREEDVTLDEIYRFLPDKYKRKEIKTELKVCKANPEVYELYKQLKSQGKKIYAISDMYLPREVIEQILINCGYELDGVYVSSDIKLSKTTGNLFKYFLHENNLKPGDVLHIGDNEIADIECAEMAGINALHVSKHENRLTYLQKSRDLYLKGFVNHRLNDYPDRAMQIGYEMLGPIIVSFCQWINKKNREFGFDRLFFMSRDMHIVYDAYNELYGSGNTDYLIISRNAINNAAKDSSGICNYLKKVGCLGNVALVDTGWRCVAQPVIEHYAGLVDKNTNIGGLYLGAKTVYRYIPRYEKSASCFYSSRIDLLRAETYSVLIESFLGSGEHKVVDYDKNGTPVFGNEEKNVEQIKKLQKAALDFVSDWKSETKNRRIAPDDAFVAYKDIQNYPLDGDIAVLGECDYDDVEVSPLVYYHTSPFKNPQKWLSDLSLSAWKGAYFKKSFKFYKPFYYGYRVFDSLLLSMKDVRIFKGKDISFLLEYYK